MYIRYQERQRNRVNIIEENVSSRMTYITLTVSIYTLSYLPVFFLQITLQSIQEDRLPSVQIAFMRIIEQSYVLNHVANPCIYSIFDERFRKNVCYFSSLN